MYLLLVTLFSHIIGFCFVCMVMSWFMWVHVGDDVLLLVQLPDLIKVLTRTFPNIYNKDNTNTNYYYCIHENRRSEWVHVTQPIQEKLLLKATSCGRLTQRESIVVSSLEKWRESLRRSSVKRCFKKKVVTDICLLVGLSTGRV